MSKIINVAKYSHCIMGKYELGPPLPKHQNSMGQLEAEQYYESTGTKGVVPFKFLAELKMTQNGQILFDAYFSTLRVVVQTMLAQTEEYCARNQITPASVVAEAQQPISKRLGIRIRAFIPVVYKDRADVEVLFYIEGSDTGEKDFDSVAAAVGPVMLVKLAECLAVPLEQAKASISALDSRT